MTGGSYAGPPLRVALVGYGLGGATFHAPLISSTPGLTLDVIMTGDSARISAVLLRYPGVSIVRSADELWSRASSLDLVVVSSPNATHAPLAMEALARGLHVVLDKPFAVTAAEAREVADEARRRLRLAIPFQNRRWDGDFLTLQRLLRDGALGDVQRFESRFERWREVAKPRWCTPDAAARGEGVLHDLGSHLVDQALMLFGPAAAVYAELDRRAPGVTVPDDAYVALTHVSGVRSHLHVSTRTALPGARMRVFGSGGAYVKHGTDVQEDALGAGRLPGAGWGEEPRERWGRIGIGNDTRPVPTEPGAYQCFYQGVVSAVKHGALPPVAADAGIAIAEVLDAARESAEKGSVVTLSPTAR